MKNPNGAGSVYKLSGKRRKPWIVVITTGYDENGKQLRKSCGTFASKKEALVKLSDCIVNYETYKQSIKLNDILLEKIKYKIISSSTAYGYDRIIKKIINDYGDKEINKFTFTEIQNFINKHQMTLSSVCVIQAIFKYAFEQRYISSNFSYKLMPYIEKKLKIPRIEITDKEIDITLRYIIEHKDDTSWEDVTLFRGAVAIIVLTHTGLRVDEFINLKTKDINFKENYIKVSKSKTKSGLRVVPMTGIVKEILPCLHVNDKSEYYISDKLDEFEPVPAQRIRTRFKNFSKKFLEVEHKPHDARHTFASKLDREGIPRSIIQKLMGHSRIDIANTYIHKTIEELQESVSKVF